MDKIKKEIRICFIDDDETTRSQLVELAQSDFPLAEVTAKEKLAYAFRGLNTYSLVVIDISAVTEDMLHPEWGYGPIRHFMREYSAPNILITSGMSLNAVHDFVDDLKNYLDDGEMAGRVYSGGWAGDWGVLKRKIVELHPKDEYKY
jgi:hypothetical protein